MSSGRGGRGRSGGGSTSATTPPQTGASNSSERTDGGVKVGVAWINGRQNAETYLDDLVSDGIYLRFAFDVKDLNEIPEGYNVLAFPNKNKVGQAPDWDFIALPPRPQQS